MTRVSMARARAAALAALTLLATGSLAAAVPRGEAYVARPGDCGGFPRAPIDMADGYCAGLVFAAQPGAFAKRPIKTPRTLLQLDDTHWLVTDLGRWTAGQGGVWLLTVKGATDSVAAPLFGGLAMPHTLARGPDGLVYVGEMSRITRFDPADGEPELEPVITGLPDNRLHENRHPLSHFLFEPNGDLLVNIGAPTDQCAPPKGTPRAARCADSEGVDAKASLRRYKRLADGRYEPKYTLVARGLRNSLVLVRHASGTVLQAENSYDYAPSAGEPHEELNVIVPDAHYGWPYCADVDRATPMWKDASPMDCASAAHAKPERLLPPHAAPLAALYYDGRMFPELSGKLLMTWHGHYATGSRLVAFDVDARGVPKLVRDATYPETRADGTVAQVRYPEGAPAANVRVLTIGWDRREGERPLGAPVGISVAKDGAIWLVDDRNAAILRIVRDAAAR